MTDFGAEKGKTVITPEVVIQLTLPDSKPGLPRSWVVVEQAVAGGAGGVVPAPMNAV